MEDKSRTSCVRGESAASSSLHTTCMCVCVSFCVSVYVQGVFESQSKGTLQLPATGTHTYTHILKSPDNTIMSMVLS